jgi:hypothetical protein
LRYYNHHNSQYLSSNLHLYKKCLNSLQKVVLDTRKYTGYCCVKTHIHTKVSGMLTGRDV